MSVFLSQTHMLMKETW